MTLSTARDSVPEGMGRCGCLLEVVRTLVLQPETTHRERPIVCLTFQSKIHYSRMENMFLIKPTTQFWGVFFFYPKSGILDKKHSWTKYFVCASKRFWGIKQVLGGTLFSTNVCQFSRRITSIR